MVADVVLGFWLSQKYKDEAARLQSNAEYGLGTGGMAAKPQTARSTATGVMGGGFWPFKVL